MALLAADGSASHPHVAALMTARAAQRDLADAVHAVCAVHGSAAERFHEAAARSENDDVHGWLDASAKGFAGERSYLAAMVSAAGPLPSTPGQAQTEQALATTRHALQMLALSDRRGCMVGAAAALLLDWDTIRALLDHAAARFGVSRNELALPERRRTMAVIAAQAGDTAVQRAISFGAQQVLAQHRALWDLLEARAGARISD